MILSSATNCPAEGAGGAGIAFGTPAISESVLCRRLVLEAAYGFQSAAKNTALAPSENY